MPIGFLAAEITNLTLEQGVKKGLLDGHEKANLFQVHLGTTNNSIGLGHIMICGRIKGRDAKLMSRGQMI